MESKVVGAFAPCLPGPAERRAGHRALAYWESLRGERQPPHLLDIDLNHDAELAPHLYLVSLKSAFEQSLFTYCGGVLGSAVGSNPTGKIILSALPGDLGEQMVEFLKGAVQYRQPLADSGSLLNGDGAEMLYRNILMPLVGHSGTVEQMFGAFSYRIVM